MENVLLVIHLLTAISLIVIILLQRSEGGALGGLGGGGGSMGFVTARGAGNILTRATAILATIFMVTSLSLSLLAQPKREVKGSLLDKKPVAEQPVEAPTGKAPVAPISGE